MFTGGADGNGQGAGAKNHIPSAGELVNNRGQFIAGFLFKC